MNIMKHPISASLVLAVLLLPTSALAQRPDRPGRSRPMEEQPRGLQLRAEGACEGYTLFTPLQSTSTYLIDLGGEVVHEWPSEYRPGNAVYLLENGNLLRCCHVTDNPIFRSGGTGGRIQEQAWDGTVLWNYSISDEKGLQHHDIEPLPNGNVLVISYEARTRQEAIDAGRDPRVVDEWGFWPDKIFEVKPIRPDGGEVVWEWRAFDHLVQDFDPDASGHGDVTAHPERIDINADHRSEPPMDEEVRRRQEEVLKKMRELGYVGDDDGEEEERNRRRRDGRRISSDWLHTNSVDYHAQHDLILLSVHSLSELWVIDHSTTTKEAAGSEGGRFGRGGDLLYRWGNPRNYGAGGSTDQKLFRQHDARWVESEKAGELRVTIFNNGTERPDGRYSSIDEIVLPFDPEQGFTREAGKAFGPDEVTWTYTTGDESFFSSFISGAERLPGGNTLICSGAQSRVFEVTGDGEIVWDYYCSFGTERSEPGGERRGAPDGGPPPPGPPGRDRGPGAGGPGRRGPSGLFRAERIAPDYPGLATLEVDGE